MIKTIRCRVLPQVWADAEKLEAQLCREQGVARTSLRGLRTLHSSIDARQRQVMVQLDLEMYIDEDPPQRLFTPVVYRELPATAPRAIVVGAGPGGLFAALRLIELGVRPIVLERGRDVGERRRDVALITRQQRVNPDSNFCFGEGGAGAFSDGKLFTRSKKRGNVQGSLERLCQFGADTGILDASHPHIGTDRLPGIIARIRQQIIECGGEIHFSTAVADLVVEGPADKPTRVCGVVTRDGAEYLGPVILATGHSARDVYRMLHRRHIRLERKGLAMGCRLEHPQPLIDQIRYHSREGRGQWLPAAEYSFVTQAHERGVYSFCMCPGGVIVPSATAAEQVVVNGMSASSRGGRWANSAMVTEVRPDDAAEYVKALRLDTDVESPLVFMEVQEALERLAWQHGGGTQVAPAQRMTDFVAGRGSASLPASSYTPGVTASPMHEWMPAAMVKRMQMAFGVFGQKARGFLTAEAQLVGIETRTSSPVRIPRDPATLCHPDVAGLYPCGEGAGFAGGIISAAIDGERCAEAVAAWGK